MTDALLKLGQTLRKWLDSPEVTGTLDRFASLDSHTWRELAEHFPDEVSWSTVRRLTERSHSLLGVAPLESVNLAHLATQMVAYCEYGDSTVEVEGDAWRGYARALLEVGRYAECESAVSTAATIYSLGSKALTHNLAILGLIQGQLYHTTGRTSEGLLIVEQFTNALLVMHDDKKNYVKGQLLRAYLLASDKKNLWEAIEVFETTIVIAQELKDNEMLAAILNNVGVCYTHVGELDKARKFIQTAFDILIGQGLKADALRSRTALAGILAKQGKYSRAIWEFKASQDEFISLGLPVDAALAGLEVANLLPLAGRSAELPALCLQLIETFSNAGLHRRAMEALSHLNQRVHEVGYATDAEIDEVRNVLESVRTTAGGDDRSPPP